MPNFVIRHISCKVLTQNNVLLLRMFDSKVEFSIKNHENVLPPHQISNIDMQVCIIIVSTCLIDSIFNNNKNNSPCPSVYIKVYSVMPVPIEGFSVVLPGSSKYDHSSSLPIVSSIGSIILSVHCHPAAFQ